VANRPSSTEHTPTLLTQSILACSKKRAYVAYEYCRTSNIWLSRDDLMAYEQALAIEAEIVALLDGPGVLASTGPGRGRPLKGKSPIKLETPRKTPIASGSIVDSPTQAPQPDYDDAKLTPTQRAAMLVLDRTAEILPAWRVLVLLKSEGERRSGGLERFETGMCRGIGGHGDCAMY
jgi:Fanconi-associated nuclease 1